MASTSLRAVTHRLTTTPVDQLPQIASFLATSLSDCGELLSTTQNQKTGKSESDNAVQIHKLKTRLASLLQDRSIEGRWTAVVLVKATVEAGQWEVLRGCEPLVRSLIAILNKSDPVSTKKMSIITLTRIFHLTYQYPTLVREITTPSLPGFITSSLNLISVKPSSEPIRKLKPNTPFLEIVLSAFLELIARHPTIFRPFSAQLHSLLQAIIGATAPTFSGSVLDLAEQLFIALHNCAPKNTHAEEWKNASRMVIASIHRTADYVFRGVVEQWESVDASVRQAGQSQDYSRVVADAGPDSLGLAGWEGIHAGVERLTVLLRLLSRILAAPTASTVTIPLGSILDLTSRLNSTTVPAPGADVPVNLQISREERDGLWAELPRIHAVGMELLLSVVNALETGVVSVGQTILEQTLWVYRAEKFNKEIRNSVYDLLHALLPLVGPSTTKKNVSSLTDIIRSCCYDLLPPAGDSNASSAPSSDSKGKSKTNQATVNADSFLNPTSKNRQVQSSASFDGLKQSASDFLPVVLNFVPTHFLTTSLRAEIDRTAILTSDKNAMLASVLNPVPALKGRGVGSSIIPFLVQGYAAEMEVETLIRPRMPVLMNAPHVNGYGSIVDDEDEEQDEHQAVPVQHGNAELTGFLKATATPILPSNTAPTDSGRKSPTALNKRGLPEETKPSPSTVPTSKLTGSRTVDVQAKKARLDTDTVSAQPSLGRASPDSSTVTATSAPMPMSAIQTSTGVADVSMSGTSTAQTGATAVAASEDESDDEIPALNMESDTDDEDEEMDD
ncbi:RIX1/PELP1 family protein [Aspergillus clavatus NRRL 1]|uniref:Pre-rRNA-processing protein RIX1 n=1 Tax=Aspergillus clavatus (strain ATCC 1007 / CBS 513.65 / DSM 816 / NCTC 3887 / NRRL 1 / QM 1276 / 107) TaxID=344612 RepID=A1C9Z8_ASPCL|nr:uncharacterized protein ACLA_009890 [Aspergillus clavatus NRRL 1]EAW12566.1 conserved hypothetical protein [Aspergillus clavatus NRRL 1]